MSHRLNLVRLGLAFFCASRVVCTAAESHIALDVLKRDGYGYVDLVPGSYALFVPTWINGVKVDLLLDTGFSAPGITLGGNPAAFHIAPEKGVGAMISAFGTRVPIGHGLATSVRMGNVQINGAPIYFGRFTKRGFLGRGFLHANSAIVDLNNLRLYLRPPGKGSRANLSRALTGIGMAEVSFSEGRTGFLVEVEVNGVRAQMALDTGAQRTHLDERFAKEAKTRGWGRNARTFDSSGHAIAADLGETKSFAIGGIPIKTSPVVLSRFSGYDLTGGKLVGVVGIDVLAKNRAIIDFGEKKFYFARAK